MCSVGKATNAAMTPLVSAVNGNAVVPILRECLHKCLLSREPGRRHRGPFVNGLFLP